MIVAACEHPATAARCRAERAFLRALQGGCQVPIAVTSEVSRSESDASVAEVTLYGIVLSLDGQEVVEGIANGDARSPEVVGEALANDLVSKGAERILGDLTERRPITYSVVAE